MAIQNIPNAQAQSYAGIQKAADVGKEPIKDNPIKAQAEARLQAVNEKIEQGEVTPENIRAQTQAALIMHLFGGDDQVSETSRSLQLTYKAAIEKINEIMASEFGEEQAISVEKLQEQGSEYWNAENTASRIVQGATSFFASYQERHADEDLATQLDGFMNLIGGGIDSGFADAKGILEGLNVFQGNVSGTFEQTYAEVQKQLNAFREQILGPQQEENPDESANTSPVNEPVNPATDTPPESPSINLQA